MESEQIEKDIDNILNSKKYKPLNIPRDTIAALFYENQSKTKAHKALVKLVRHKLHNIVAPYLGDPDYLTAQQDLTSAFQEQDNDKSIKMLCSSILESHASTHERIPYLDTFYGEIFKVTGTPDTILDLACGMNPFSFRWMGLPRSIRYHAYDLHDPRIQLINHYFKLEGLQPDAEWRDILLYPPEIKADVAFFFKEAHRFEQRQHGCNRAFWQALNVDTLVVSLPAASLDGKRSLIQRQYRLISNTIAGLPWKMTDLIIGNEIIFVINK